MTHDLNERRERYKPAAVCPKCGRAPAFRIFAATVHVYSDLAPVAPMIEYQCNRQGCGTVFTITARAYQRATPERKAA